jgi:hypothetical protein
VSSSSDQCPRNSGRAARRDKNSTRAA